MTNEEALQKSCPNGAAIAAAERHYNESAALMDPGRYEAARESARQYYRCSTLISNRYYRAVATLLYLTSMHQSFRTNGDVIRGLPKLYQVATDLLTEIKDGGSKYENIRRWLEELKGEFAKEYSDTHQEIYGTNGDVETRE